MHPFFTTLKLGSIAFFGMMVLATQASADPVWHCSRSHVQIADASDDFTLAALNLDREVIRISLRDLYTAYQGTPVRMNGGTPLSACIVDQPSNLTSSALQSIGAKHAPLKALGSKQQLVKSHLVLVKDEAEMITCITQHHPAIGYLSKVTNTEAVGPCF